MKKKIIIIAIIVAILSISAYLLTRPINPQHEPTNAKEYLYHENGWKYDN